MSRPVALSVLDLACRYQQQPVVQGVSFELPEGDIACLLGPSGCGKTTTLRAIAGLEPLTGGRIQLHGRTVSSAEAQRPPEQRGLGMVFQEHALFPHLSVGDNVAFGLRQLSSSARRARVEECLALVQLSGLARRYPHELSGGQQQRVALARALAPRPALLLLDEPFASLDLDLRRQLNQELRRILRQQGMTALMVTHDQDEAFTMADHLGVMRGGKLEQWDSPEQVYACPASRFVAQFSGSTNWLPARAEAGALQTALGPLPLPTAALPAGALELLVRPEAVLLGPPDGGQPAQVLSREFLGGHCLYRLQLACGTELWARGSSGHRPGDQLGVSLMAAPAVCFAAD